MTEPSPARPLTERERWAQLLTTRHSPRRWAQIADAIRTADTARHDVFGDPIARGERIWCQLVLTALERPPTAATGHYPAALADRVLADADLLRTWLTAPAPNADTVVVINVDAIESEDWNAVSDPVHRTLTHVLAAGQHVGVYGVAGYRIELHSISEDSSGRHSIVIARPEFGPGLATPLIPDGDLIPDESQDRVGRVVQSLITIAAQVDNVLNQQDLVAGRSPTNSARLGPLPATGVAEVTPGGHQPRPPGTRGPGRHRR